jgi:glycosyltransferase involved in cell wall biosynthesis
MRVCVISTTIMTLPPAGYSGLEMLAYQQAEGLAKKGHEVLLIAPTGSTTPPGVELHGTTLREGEMQAYSGYWQRLPLYDAVIDNSWQKWSYILKKEGKLKAPVLGVLHAPAETMFADPPPVEKPCLVAISRDQAGAVSGHLYSPAGESVRARVAYNGIDMDFYQNSGRKRSDRYLFLGRMSKLNGPHVAVSAAKACNVTLDLVGDDKLVENPAYVAAVKSSCEGTQIVYHGEKRRKDCVAFFSGGKALLHCSFVFREPFGLAPVEAQACGCPVVAPDYGAMRETVKPGETGFLIRTQDELEELIRSDAVASIKPEVCREWASQFSVQKMVDRYESLCHEAIDSGGW